MNLLKRVNLLQERGIRITLDWVNQIENGKADAVARGDWPLWTCTATAWHTITHDGKEIEDVVNAISADSVSDALEGLLELIEEQSTKEFFDEDGNFAPYGLCSNGDGNASLKNQSLCYDCYMRYRR